jgi:hypothetical protein
MGEYTSLNFYRIAEQLGHSNPELRLHVYARAMPVDGNDLAFADFGGANSGAKRLFPAPGSGLQEEEGPMTQKDSAEKAVRDIRRKTRLLKWKQTLAT